DELKDLADAMNDMTMGLRNKVINLKEVLSQIDESIAATKSTGKIDKLDDAVKAVAAMQESLGSFILEKERRERKSGDEEGAEDSASEEYSKA
ncbi:MAG: hypothetical protein ACOYXC_18280, partial [Candidatus Rifleibacteriota bacterium]